MKELRYILALLAAIPVWIQLALYLFFSVAAVAVAGYFGTEEAINTAIILVAIGVLYLVIRLVFGWARSRREAELRGEINHDAARLRVARDETGMAARVREAFAAGFEVFRRFRKDPYELPWYAVVGEPGAGKSRLIDASGLEFPLEGAGSPRPARTQDLGWRFTNFAIFLDTTGGMVFDATDAPVTPGWAELGNQLLRHRKKCPLNGIIVAVPAQSLLSDSRSESERKAGTLARHLDTLRRQLDVRVPAFLVVTQCDRLPGFSAFFSEQKEDRARQQILGWSNPAPLEAPLRPELVGEHFVVLGRRLRRRRLAAILDPVPAQPGTRRADEVDELFGFPDQFGKLLPNLNCYLENTFVAGEWSIYPLFLRGVYLTAAPEADPSCQPAFLRDLFLDKILREDSLVTREGTGSMERFRRRLLLFVAGTAVLAVLFVLALLAYMRLSARQEARLGLWDRAAAGWTGNTWTPIISSDSSNPRVFSYQGNSVLPSVRRSGSRSSTASMSLVDFHAALAADAAKPFVVPPVFVPFTLVGVNPDWGRARAQKVMFDVGVVKPLLEGARQKMSTSPAPSSPLRSPAENEAMLAAEAKALTELVRVEVAIVRQEDNRPDSLPGATFLPSLLNYTTGTTGSEALIGVMNWTFGQNRYGRGRWAPGWTTGGHTIAENSAIREGIDRLVNYAKHRVSLLEENLTALSRLADKVTTYVDAENALAKAASAREDWAASEAPVANAFEALEGAKLRMEQELLSVRTAGLFEGGPETLSSALDMLTSSSESHLGQVDVIMDLVTTVLPKQAAPATPAAIPATIPIPSSWESSRLALFEEIRDRLTGTADLIEQKIKTEVTGELVKVYADLDTKVLDSYEGQPAYLWRWDAYRQAAAGAPDFHFQEGMYLVDSRWATLGECLGALDTLQRKVDTYSGSQAADCLTISSYFVGRAKHFQTRLFAQSYVQQARDALVRIARFPLVWPPGPDIEALGVNQIHGAKALLDAIAADLSAPVFASLKPAEVQNVLDFARMISPLFAVVDGLVKPDGTMSNLRVVLYNGGAQQQLSGPNFAPLPAATPTPTPPPRSLMSKLFGGGPKPGSEDDMLSTIDLATWNAVGLANGGIVPLSARSDTVLGEFAIQDPFSFRVYHSLISQDGSDLVDGGTNWSALRFIARLGGKPIGVGQDWQVALRPKEPNSVWIKFSFDVPLPTVPWPTLDSLGLRPLPGQSLTPSPTPAATPGSASPGT